MQRTQFTKTKIAACLALVAVCACGPSNEEMAAAIAAGIEQDRQQRVEAAQQAVNDQAQTDIEDLRQETMESIAKNKIELDEATRAPESIRVDALGSPDLSRIERLTREGDDLKLLLMAMSSEAEIIELKEKGVL